MLTPFEICGMQARAKHCRARLTLTSNGRLRSFLRHMLKEAEETLEETSQIRRAVRAKVRQVLTPLFP